MAEISHYNRSLTSSVLLMWSMSLLSLLAWTPFNHRYSLCQYLLDYLVLFHKEVVLQLLGAFQIKHLIIICVIPGIIPLPYLTLQTRTPFCAARDNKINNCGFKFSMVCKRHILIEEDKDKSLQFAKVFPAKFLKLPIHQSFPLSPFCTIQYIALHYC